MEHAYNSGRMRTHSHQIQLDGGEKSTKKLYRYSSELQISTKPLKISSNVTSSAHVASLAAFGAKLRENAMLSQVWRLTERSVLLNPAVDQSGWGGGANRFHTNAYEPNRYHQPRENFITSTQNIAGEYLVFLFFPQISFTERTHPATNTAI